MTYLTAEENSSASEYMCNYKLILESLKKNHTKVGDGNLLDVIVHSTVYVYTYNGQPLNKNILSNALHVPGLKFILFL